ncbi:MAG: hypothetical protein ACE5FK_10905 [Candidatus Methylomirabilia bacterium]
MLAEKNTGSYGSGTGRFTMLSLGEKRWNGRKVIVYSDGATATYQDSRGRLLAIVRGSRRVATFEPYFATFDWPLYVGKQWLNRYRYTDHERGQTYDNLQQDARVEAYEKVKTPAGTFKAFKIVLANPLLEEVVWWSPGLGIFVKYKLERFRGHPLKAGTRERVLVSYSLKR